MKRYSNIDLQNLTRQMVAADLLSVDAQDGAITHPAPPWLKITQEGGLVENRIFDLDCGGGMGCILDLRIAVDRGAFSIRGWELDLPWKDPKFRWLPESPGGKFPDNVYRIPACKNLMYSRDQVINHRRLLQRGKSLHGLLLGFSVESIPESYRHGAKIDATLVLIDEMLRSFSEPVHLCADRSAKFDRQSTKKRTRRSIFENLVEGVDILKDDEDVMKVDEHVLVVA